MGRAQTGAKTFGRKKKVRTFRALETEIFYILNRPQGLDSGQNLSSLYEEIDELVQPVWNMPPNGRVGTHPYGSPVCRQAPNRLLTEPENLSSIVCRTRRNFEVAVNCNAMRSFEIDMHKWIERVRLKMKKDSSSLAHPLTGDL